MNRGPRRKIHGIGWIYLAIITGIIRLFTGPFAINDGLLVLAVAFFCAAVLRMWWAAAYVVDRAEERS